MDFALIRDPSYAAVKTLYLLRHAKSSWDDPGLPDFDRPLAKRGRKACVVIAEHIEREGIAPEMVLCSPSRRTRETLAGILDAIPGNSRIERPDELYGGGAGTILALVNGVPDDAASVMVIGHNPGIQAATLQLAGAGEQLDEAQAKFPTATLATIEANIDAWLRFAPGSGTLVGFVRPRDLEASS
jgi:phosphohistidine phosphatase